MSFEISYSVESHERIKEILIFADKSLFLLTKSNFCRFGSHMCACVCVCVCQSWQPVGCCVLPSCPFCYYAAKDLFRLWECESISME